MSFTSLPLPQETPYLMMMNSGVVQRLGPIKKNICCTALPHPTAMYMVCKLQSTEQDISWGATHHSMLGIHTYSATCSLVANE